MRLRLPQIIRRLGVSLALLITLVLILAPQVAAQDAADVAFSPASGTAQVIAQGVAPLPEGNVVWRTVRARALPLADAPFEAQPLSFVLATTGPLLLTNEDGSQIQLGTGEAALTPGGAVQQRASLSDQEASFLSIELVPEDAAPPANATVLQPGAPFAAPNGAHDLDLVADLLGSGESLTIPDSGGKNVILVTDGAATVGKPDGGSAVLLAGEAASFSGELLVAPAPSGGAAADRAGFVVAIIGPEIPPPALPGSGTEAPSTPASSETPETAATTESGSITISVYDCPPGMTTTTFNAAACAPTNQDFDITISGSALSLPLTVGDASAEGENLVWGDLPLGEYVIAEAVLPLGYTDYGLAARGATGNSTLGYRVTLDAETPALTARIYNFTGE
ncbi:MAG: hypothetical protein M3Z20_06385 [Chloroflexota bacterium]|nr:hypothetical protein [Chloroflexota bacterium]